MTRTILYHVTFAAPSKRKLLHIVPSERFIAAVKAVEDNETFRAYHLDKDGKHLVPDYAAIRDALPHYHRKAFDRIRNWWFPVTLHSDLSGILDMKNACNAQLHDSKGRLLGTIYATPYLFDGVTPEWAE